MTNDRVIEKMTRQIIELLKQERNAITKGLYTELQEINEKKVAIIVKLEAYQNKISNMPPPVQRNTELETAIGIMKRRSEENQKLLTAARRGIKAAQQTINKIENEPENFGAYDPSGQRIKASTLKQNREQFI
jgi:exonuclease I